MSKLGETAQAQTKAVKNLLKLIRRIPMDGKQDYDVLGFIYEYLISSSQMVKLADISLDINIPGMKGDENNTYDSILHFKWATDYDIVYDELKQQNYERLIHKPR